MGLLWWLETGGRGRSLPGLVGKLRTMIINDPMRGSLRTRMLSFSLFGNGSHPVCRTALQYHASCAMLAPYVANLCGHFGGCDYLFNVHQPRATVELFCGSAPYRIVPDRLYQRSVARVVSYLHSHLQTPGAGKVGEIELPGSYVRK